MTSKVDRKRDVIRGLGFVALYSAYAEEQADELLKRLAPAEPFDYSIQSLPISKKLRHAARAIKKLGSAELDNLNAVLLNGPALFEKRNELGHGRFYAGRNGKPDKLKSGRANTPDREIDAEELYELAKAFKNYAAELRRPTLTKIPRVLSQHNLSAKKT